MRGSSHLLSLILSALLVGCGGGGGHSSSGGVDLTKGLIHEWKFDGNAKDAVGTLDGTVIGSPTYATAAVGQGIVLDGTTTGVDVPIGADTQFQGSFTVSAWVKMNSLPPSDRLWASILFDGDDEPGNDPFALLVGPGGDLQFQLTGDHYIALAGTMPVGQLVLVTGTYDKAAGAMRLYLNGQLVTEHLNDTTLTPVTGGLDSSQHAGIGIGNANGFPDGIYNWGLNGILDDVRMYDRALSASEVQALYKVH